MRDNGEVVLKLLNMNDRDGLYKLDVSYACKMVLEMVLDVRSVLPFELRERFFMCVPIEYAKNKHTVRL